MRLLCLSDEYQKYGNSKDTFVWITYRCFEGIRYCREHNLEYEVIEEIFSNIDEFHDGQKEITKYVDILVDYIGEWLNDLHEIGYSKKQWDILLSIWLYYFVSSYYEKYCKLNSLGKNSKYCTVMVKSDYICLDLGEYQQLLDDNFYVAWQYSNLLDYFEYENIKISDEIVWEHISGKRKVSLYRQIKNYIWDKYNKGKKIFIQNKLIDANVAVYNSCLPDDFYDEIAIINDVASCLIYDEYDDHFRAFIKNKYTDKISNNRIVCGLVPEEDWFLRFLKVRVKKELPIVFLEAWDYIGDKIKRSYNRFFGVSSVIYNDSATHTDEITKRYLAEAIGKRIKLFDLQHGGGYGMCNSEYHHLMYRLPDYFITWGWVRDMKSIPVTMTKRLCIDNIMENRTQILFIGYSFPKYVVRIAYACEYWFDKFLEFNISFLEGLKYEVKKQLKVRLYKNDYGWNIREQLDNRGIGISYDEEIDFSCSLLNSKLLIVAGFDTSTTILEALFAGIPFIAIQPLEYLELEDDARVLVNELIEQKIIIGSSELAAQFLNDYYDRVDEWWSEPSRAACIERFRNKYAYAPSNRVDIWKEFLRKLGE